MSVDDYIADVLKLLRAGATELSEKDLEQLVLAVMVWVEDDRG